MPVLIEKSNISSEMWNALKAHINKKRQKKKLEQDAARKEKEIKIQTVMTLEETKAEIIKMEQALKQLRGEKHQLFSLLKRVLNEDEAKRRARESSVIDVGLDQPSLNPTRSQSNMFLQSGHLTTKRTLNEVSSAPKINLMSNGKLKRPHSPSPPPASVAYVQPFNYKNQTVSPYNQKPAPYPASRASLYYSHPSNPAHSTQSYSPECQVSYSYASHAQYPGNNIPATPQQQQQPSPNVEPRAKHSHHASPMQHVPRGYIGPLMHQPIEHSLKPSFSDDKYYVVQQHPSVTIRSNSSQNVVHHTQNMFPVQQQSLSTKGGITFGYPVRAQPPGPPPTSSVYSPVTTSSHSNSYNVSQSGLRHGYPSQPPPGRYY